MDVCLNRSRSEYSSGKSPNLKNYAANSRLEYLHSTWHQYNWHHTTN